MLSTQTCGMPECEGHLVIKPNRLWFVSQEVQGPITEGGADAKVGKLGDQLGKFMGVKL